MITQIKQRALNSLNGKWGQAIGITFVASVITGAASNIPLVGTILVGFPLTVGVALYFLNLLKGYGEFDNLFSPFRENFIETAITMFLMQLYVFLWSLLLIIPGIIKSLSYAMTPYILAESNGYTQYNDAIDESRRLMDGHKMEYFLLNLSFIGWVFVCILTLGIGFFWLIPYISAAQAEFYYHITDGNSRTELENEQYPDEDGDDWSY